LTTVLLFDDSLSLQFGSGQCSKRDALLEMAGLFALLSAGNRDRMGFWHATPQGEAHQEPVRGRNRIVTTAASLLNQPIPKIEDGGNVEIDWRLFYRAFPRHSLVIWLGDFAPGPIPPGWAALRKRYQVIGVRVDDPWERELPKGGQLNALDPASGDLIPFDLNARANRRRHQAWVEEREQTFQSLFPAPTQRLAVTAGEDLLEALVRFFHTRMHQRKL